jgi:hypothetical protein
MYPWAQDAIPGRVSLQPAAVLLCLGVAPIVADEAPVLRIGLGDLVLIEPIAGIDSVNQDFNPRTIGDAPVEQGCTLD